MVGGFFILGLPQFKLIAQFLWTVARRGHGRRELPALRQVNPDQQQFGIARRVQFALP
jgi:hypothetical protein